ncbi:MAG: leucine-rich repeat protein, partial [Muribaculaceae bacterium]|nr:leucine-rich repeat protein [Muribaculaceae bacterium]
MKKFLFTTMSLLVATVMWGGTLYTSGNLIYEVISEPTSSSYGSVKVYSLSNAGKSVSDLSLYIPGRVYLNTKYYNVTQIADAAFSGQTNIKVAQMSYNIGTIGYQAFKGCSNMSTVWIPSSVWRIMGQAFMDCPNLTSVYIASPTPPSGGWFENTFDNGKATLYIGKGDKNGIEKYKAEAGCYTSRFKAVKKHSYAMDIADGSGYYRVTTPDPYGSGYGECVIVGLYDDAAKESYAPTSATTGADGNYYNIISIVDSACVNQTTLKNLDFTKLTSLKEIGEGAFRGCTSLASVTTSVPTISADAFRGCTALTYFSSAGYTGLNLKEGVKSIGASAFYGCTSLVYFYLPASVTNMSSYACDGCKNLKCYYVNDNNANYSAYDSCLYDKSQSTLLRVPQQAQKFEAPNALVSISSYAFEDNTRMTNIVIPYGVKSFGTGCFRRMTSLNTVLIPGSVRSIGSNAFSGCTALNSVYSGALKPVKIDASNVFKDCPKGFLTVPFDFSGGFNENATNTCIQAYKDAGWTGFSKYNAESWQAYDFTVAIDGVNGAPF